MTYIATSLFEGDDILIEELNLAVRTYNLKHFHIQFRHLR